MTGGTENNCIRLPDCADDKHLLPENMNIRRKSTDDSKKVGTEIRVNESEYRNMSVPRQLNSGGNNRVKICDKSFQHVTKCNYLGMKVTN
jgi:hypothetical protein